MATNYIEYTVKDNDTIESIAANEIGDVSQWRKIALINELDFPYVIAEKNTDILNSRSKYATGSVTFALSYIRSVDTLIPKGVLLELGRDGLRGRVASGSERVPQYYTLADAYIPAGTLSTSVGISCTYPGVWGNTAAKTITELVTNGADPTILTEIDTIEGTSDVTKVYTDHLPSRIKLFNYDMDKSMTVKIGNHMVYTVGPYEIFDRFVEPFYQIEFHGDCEFKCQLYELHPQQKVKCADGSWVPCPMVTKIYNAEALKNGRSKNIKTTGDTLYLPASTISQVSQATTSYEVALGGVDLVMDDEGDYVADPKDGDLALSSGYANIQQSFMARLATRRGSVKRFPWYGSNSHYYAARTGEYIKELISLDMVATLKQDDRVSDVNLYNLTVTKTALTITADVTLVNGDIIQITNGQIPISS